MSKNLSFKEFISDKKDKSTSSDDEVLNETPMVKSGDYKPDDVKGGSFYISDKALERSYDKIGEMKRDDLTVSFHLSKKTYDKVIRATIPGIDQNGEEKNEIIFRVFFKDKNNFVKYPESWKGQEDKVLQVSSAYINEKYKDLGIASKAYQFLVDKGYIVVSDCIQYKDGQELWRKLSRQSGKDYKVFIVDSTSGEILCDENGNAIEYNSKNLIDDKIWSMEPDRKSITTLLFMNK
jgi:hypothetical protein